MTEQTVKERATELGLRNYDTALPQDWFDIAIHVTKFGECWPTGLNPSGHIVWCYDVPSVFGIPEALTVEGESIIGLVEGRPFLNLARE